METTTIKTTTTDNRRAAVNGLAVVGFIVLVILGMALAVYAARFVPVTINRIGAAAVYLSSEIFPAGDEADLEVVPPETVPFGDDTASSTPATSTPATPDTTVVTGTGTTQAGTPTTTVIPVQVPASVNYYGLPDLAIENVRTGYLTAANTDTFRAADEVPDGKRGAVKFTIVNNGTNVSDRFEFEAKLPTTRTYTYTSKAQKGLRPTERIEYTLGFDQAKEGNNRTITIEVDQDDDIDESNERNNSRSVTIDIED